MEIPNTKFHLGDTIVLDAIHGTVEEIIFRRGANQPLYHISYWHEGKKAFITVLAEEIEK